MDEGTDRRVIAIRGADDRIQELLRLCTARVTDEAGKSNGAGFFIDGQHLITCAHVITSGDRVRVVPYKGVALTGKVVDMVAEDDLALIELDQVDATTDQPAVVLSTGVSGRNLYAAGYPKNEVNPGGLEVLTYQGNLSYGSDGSPLSLMLTGGQVNFGMSGGAVLDPDTGAVVAVVRYSKNVTSTLGGGAIPIVLAAQRFELVRQYLVQPPLAARGWRELIGSDGWQSLGYSPSWSGQLDVRVGGTRSKWWVGLDDQKGRTTELTIRDLGEEVAKVLFQWADVRRVRSADEVRLIGRLLSAALFPQDIKQRLDTIRHSDEVLVRLGVEGSELVDVPWELATIPAADELFLAAEPNYRFVRVAPKNLRDPSPPTSTPTTALGIVVQPTTATRWPMTFTGNYPMRWPDLDEAVDKLRTSLALVAPEPRMLVNPRASEVKEALAKDQSGGDRQAMIVHYQGLGQFDGTQTKLAVWNDGLLSFIPMSDFAKWMANCGARLLVIELTTPPDEFPLEPVTPSGILNAIDKQVCALVCTRSPVHAALLIQFNRALYECLARSATIEEAVQSARGRLKTDETGDYAAFGWFTLLTALVPGLRFTAQTGQRDGQKSAQQVPAAKQDSGSQGPASTESRDGFITNR